MNAITTSSSASVAAYTTRGTRWQSWLWLALGAALLSFSLFQTVLPLAAWLAPVFLLRFARTQRALVALPLISLIGYLATLLALRGFFPTVQTALFALGGLTIVFAYAADRLLARRLGRITRTLVFPLADTTFSFLLGGGDFGTIGVSAYTQVGNLPLTQFASVTGIWGISFLIAWLAPVANDLWEHGFDLRAARAPIGLFVGMLLAVLLFGSLRIAFFPPVAPTVRVAALAPNRALSDATMAARFEPARLSAGERAELRARYFDPLLDDLFARTREAARGGAKIVAWSEAAAYAFKEDETAVIERARTVARDEHVYLELGMIFILPTDRSPFNENRAILIDPSGTIASDYAKTTVPLNDGNAPGPGIVPVVDTPYGRLATVICFDADLPALVRQAGQGHADILLVPSSDWAPIAEMHARTSVLRAVENGMSLVRPTRQGVSLAADPQGRLLGYKADYFVGDDQTMIVNVPTKRVNAIYPFVGENIGYVCVAGLVVLACMAFFLRRVA